MTGPELAMPSRITAGAVVYARDVNRVSAFYAGVVGLEVRHSEPAHAVPESEGSRHAL